MHSVATFKPCDVTTLQVQHWITSGEPSPSVAVDASVLKAFMDKFVSLRGAPVATLSTTDELELIGREVRTGRLDSKRTERNEHSVPHQ